MPLLTQTPMERRLLETIERLERDWQAREQSLLGEISDLRACVTAQQDSTRRLNDLLASLLEPPARH